MHEYIQEYYDNSTHSDVKVVLSDDTFIYAHKLILSRLEFFGKMFSCNFVEKQTSEIRFPQHDDNSVSELIQHIYGVLDISAIADWCKLYPLAHYVGATTLINMLDKSTVTVHITSSVIVAYAQLYSHCQLLVNNIDRIRVEKTWPSDLYDYFREIWLCNRSHAALFAHDLAYATTVDQINTYAADYTIDSAFINECWKYCHAHCTHPSPLVRMIMSMASAANNNTWYTIT
jgi:hypothetical protein